MEKHLQLVLQYLLGQKDKETSMTKKVINESNLRKLIREKLMKSSIENEGADNLSEAYEKNIADKVWLFQKRLLYEGRFGRIGSIKGREQSSSSKTSSKSSSDWPTVTAI